MGIPDAQRADRARFRFYRQMMEFYPYLEQQHAQKAQAAANFMFVAGENLFILGVRRHSIRQRHSTLAY